MLLLDRTRASTAPGCPRWFGKRFRGQSPATRSDVLTGLTGAPLQHGAFELFALALVAAAVLGLAVMLLELALGAAEREATLARLATMGLGRAAARAGGGAGGAARGARRRGRGLACALVLPWVLAPAVDLSVFTESSGDGAAVPVRGPVALPLAACRGGARRLLVELRRDGGAVSPRACGQADDRGGEMAI